jgi:hypothetical protein
MKRPLFGTRLIAGINDEPEANFRLSSEADFARGSDHVRFGSRSYGDGGKGLAPLSLCENRWRCPHDPS